MPDRCYLAMRFRLSDEEKVREVLSRFTDPSRWDQRRICGSIVTLTEHAAAYAWNDKRSELAAEGVAFIGEHGHGEECDGHAFVSDGTEMLEMALTADGRHAIPVAWDSESQSVVMDEDCRNFAEVFFRMRERVERMLVDGNSGSEQAGNTTTLNTEVKGHETANY